MKTTTTKTETTIEKVEHTAAAVSLTGAVNGEGYTITPVSVQTLLDMPLTLPDVQQVRGSVWADNTASELVRDLARGCYVPPIVLAPVYDDKGNVTEYRIADGQQRYLTIRKAVSMGILGMDVQVTIALDTIRPFAETFRALNKGVPVGKALVAAMDMETTVSNAVVSLASSRLLSSMRWTGAQTQRTAKADYAAVTLAICAGWDSPESSQKVCNNWLASHGDAVTPEAIETAHKTLDALADVYCPLLERPSTTTKAEKAQIAALKKKNLLMTAIAAVLDGCNPADVLTAYSRDALLVKTPYTVTRGKKEVNKTAVWAVGGGSSGSYSEYADRLIVIKAACDKLSADPDAGKPKDTTKATPADAVNDKAAAMLDALGVGA